MGKYMLLIKNNFASFYYSESGIFLFLCKIVMTRYNMKHHIYNIIVVESEWMCISYSPTFLDSHAGDLVHPFI